MFANYAMVAECCTNVMPPETCGGNRADVQEGKPAARHLLKTPSTSIALAHNFTRTNPKRNSCKCNE